jgi:hypothetical protein
MKLAYAVLSILAATIAPAAVDAERRFEFTPPPGWTIQPGPVPHATTLERGSDHITLSFHVSNPGRWSADWLMQAQEEAMKLSVGEMRIEKKEDLTAGPYPGAFWIHKRRGDPSIADTVVTACVILPEGGIGIIAAVPSDSMLQEVRTLAASVRPAVPPPGPESARFLAVPGHSRGILADVRGFTIDEDESRPEADARKIVFVHKDERHFLTVLIRPAVKDETPADARDERVSVLKGRAPEEVGPKKHADKETASFEYFTEQDRGELVHQKHVHRFWVSGGARYEVHVWIEQFQDSDQPWLDKLLGSFRVTK